MGADPTMTVECLGNANREPNKKQGKMIQNQKEQIVNKKLGEKKAEQAKDAEEAQDGWKAKDEKSPQ